LWQTLLQKAKNMPGALNLLKHFISTGYKKIKIRQLLKLGSKLHNFITRITYVRGGLLSDVGAGLIPAQ